jgi:hypothetical protein
MTLTWKNIDLAPWVGQWWTYLCIGTTGLGAPLRRYASLSLSLPEKTRLKVNRGQRSRCVFINWAMVNIFVYRQPGPRSSRSDDMRYFHFRDLEKTIKGQSRSKVGWGGGGVGRRSAGRGCPCSGVLGRVEMDCIRLLLLQVVTTSPSVSGRATFACLQRWKMGHF